MKRHRLIVALIATITYLTGACAPDQVSVTGLQGKSLGDPLMLANILDGNKVELVFSAEAGASIEVQKKGAGDFQGLALVSSPDDRYVDAAVTAGETYAYRARTYKDGETSEWTPDISVSLPAVVAPPAKPASPAVVAQSSTEFTATLAVPAADVSSRKLFVNEQGSTTIQSADVPLNMMAFSVKAPGFTIAADKFYEFRVRHYKGAVASEPSDVVTVKSMAAPPPPMAPQVATVTELSLGTGNSAVVKWTHNGMNLTGFRVERCVSLSDCNGNVFSMATTVGVNDRMASFDIAMIPDGGTFGARVVALGNPNAGPSNKLTMVRVVSSNPPGVPTLNSVQLGMNTTTVNWTPSSMGDPATAFKIMFCVAAVCNGPVSGFTQVGTAGAGATSYNHNLAAINPPLVEDQTIGYAVIAENSAGSSAASNVVMLAYQSNPVPRKPVLDSATKINSSVARIAYTLNPNGAPATMVKVFRALLAAGTACDNSTDPALFSPVATITPQVNPYDNSIAGIPAGTVVCYFVKAGNANGDSKKSDDNKGFVK